jgi:hypothetical protein
MAQASLAVRAHALADERGFAVVLECRAEARYLPCRHQARPRL